ncbi:ABC transporter permease [Salipaludibacillus neizhouensis]|uniref:ABC transporter permease n=1 Tax=Salipaludibacillus neizhouensis TaxID=885475 RepID=A0A3A9KE08_9BACI|nr:carbohydrate ABC transporter permease [Salipaludibacillus neizhouensis]RKL65725.1 ABC transporter permease [Salipaludibacillus neizhouensis]
MQDKTIGSRLFDYTNYFLLTLVGLTTIMPFIYVVITSFSATPGLIPKEFTLDAYRYIFSTDTFTNSLMVSIYITVLGTLINLVLTCLMAYSLSYKHLPGRNIILLCVLITMLFSGGMIPTYFVVKATGLINTLWALMIPNAISAFYLIILKNFFQQIPRELIEAAKIDGCHEIGLLFRIVLPLSLPAIAAFGLFYAVGLWNQYFNSIMYISDSDKWPVQVILRQVVILASGGIGESSSMDSDSTVTYSESIKMATIVIATIPIIIVYPFLQKHFAKGVLIGSVKE